MVPMSLLEIRITQTIQEESTNATVLGDNLHVKSVDCQSKVIFQLVTNLFHLYERALFKGVQGSLLRIV